MEWVKLFESEEEAHSILPLFSVRKITFQEIDYCLVRNRKGVFVTSNSCTHDDAALSQGSCTPNGTIVCPWHHYIFDPENGECISHSCDDLKTFPVKIGEDGVWFNTASV